MWKKWGGLAVVIIGTLVGGCAESNSGLQTTGKTVKQIKPEAASGLGDYRLVEMPEAAKRYNVMADREARETLSYYETLRPRR